MIWIWILISLQVGGWVAGIIIIAKFFSYLKSLEEIERKKLPEPPCPCDTCQHLTTKGKQFNNGYRFRCTEKNINRYFNVPPEICKYHTRKYEQCAAGYVTLKKG